MITYLLNIVAVKNTLTVAKLMWVGGACQYTMFITDPNAVCFKWAFSRGWQTLS